MAYDIKMIVKVASLYYKDGLTQEEIADKIKISKYQVNRILKRAIETGVVQITINDSLASISEFEDKLEKKFNLKRAIVVDNLGLSDKELKAKLGQVASNYLLEIIKNNDVIGVAWGTTLNEVVNHLPKKINKNVEIVQVTGGVHQISVNLNCQDIARRFAAAFNTEPHLIYAPAIVESQKLHDMLINEPSIKETFKYFDNITIALAGIGAIYPKVTSSFIETGSFNEDELSSLKNNNTVGDIFSHFFDIDGNITSPEIDKRIITISTENLLKIPYLIGIAGGEAKAEAILGALRGKYINILITDSKAAAKILKLAK